MNTETQTTESKIAKSQTRVYGKRPCPSYNEPGRKAYITATVRFDDECGNGHNSFAITGDIKSEGGRWLAGGCLHDEIATAFPELAPFIKWHLSDTNGPMHYTANALYMAGDKDHNGLRAGEFRSFVYQVMVANRCLYTSRIFYSFRDWLHRDEAHKQAADFIKDIKPELNPEIVQVGSGKPSEGKQPDLGAARRCAVWPDAELADFTKENLEARLPALLTDFRRDVETLGLTW